MEFLKLFFSWFFFSRIGRIFVASTGGVGERGQELICVSVVRGRDGNVLRVLTRLEIETRGSWEKLLGLGGSFYLGKEHTEFGFS
jgi:hypothetical protein